MNSMRPPAAAVECEHLQPYVEERCFPEGTTIFRAGSPGDGCYVIDYGEVRLEVEQPEADTDGVLGYLGPGSFLGELSLLDALPRSASAIAHTDVRARWLSTHALQRLCAEQPALGLAILTHLGQDIAGKLRATNRRVAPALAVSQPDEEVELLISRAVSAQRAFASWPEERVDALLLAIAQTIAEHAEELAVATVAEAGVGNVADKAVKNRFASLEVYRSLAGRCAAGVIRVDRERQVAEVASPVGVVLGLIPMTNPVATLVFKTLIALKGRNALVLSCHRRAHGVCSQAGALIQKVLRRHGAPPELVQWVQRRSSRAKTTQLMQHRDVDFVLATGGASLVQAAYSSGTPAIGVGPGNAPAYVCADAAVEAAARHIVASKSFDHGIICGSEHHLVVDAPARDALVAALETNGAAVLSPAEVAGAEAVLYDAATGRLRSELVGKAASIIARCFDIHRPWPIRLLVFPLGQEAIAGVFGGEKLAPILSLFTVADEAEGLAVCRALLRRGGLGHTAIIHSGDQERVARFSLAVEASRILVNGPGAQGCIGSGNGLTPSLTLGCGTFGGTSTTDNVTYTHLLNIKRIAYPHTSRVEREERPAPIGAADQRLRPMDRAQVVHPAMPQSLAPLAAPYLYPASCPSPVPMEY